MVLVETWLIKLSLTDADEYWNQLIVYIYSKSAVCLFSSWNRVFIYVLKASCSLFVMQVNSEKLNYGGRDISFLF